MENRHALDTHALSYQHLPADSGGFKVKAGRGLPRFSGSAFNTS